jgi:hypothetical protein
MKRVAGVAAVLSVVPGVAWANAGIGYLLPAAPALLLALLPVILIEAPVFAGILRLSFQAGLKLATSVNLRSTLLGFLFALVVDFGLIALGSGWMGPVPGRGPLLGALIPMFLFTLWIEDRAAARKHPELPRRRVALATLAANILSYVALAAVVIVTPIFRFYDQMGYRDNVYFASRAADRWTEAVAKHWRDHKRFPERTEDLGLPALQERRGVGAIRLEPVGRIVLHLKFPADPELDGKRLIYEPRIVGESLEWKCNAPDLAPRYAPSSCREVGGGKQ